MRDIEDSAFDFNLSWPVGFNMASHFHKRVQFLGWWVVSNETDWYQSIKLGTRLVSDWYQSVGDVQIASVLHPGLPIL
jgi:hypothetical protein